MRIQLDLTNVSFVTKEISKTQTRLQDHFTKRLNDGLNIMDVTLQKDRQHIDKRLNNLEQLLLQQIDHGQSNTTYRPHEESSKTHEEVPWRAVQASTTKKAVGGHGSLVIQDSIRITTSLWNGQVCKFGCSCACHLSRRLITPSFLEHVLGRFLIGYAGMPMINDDCNSSTCARTQTPDVAVEYQFPLWFAARIIKLQYAYQPGNGPQLQLRTLRRVPNSASCFKFALEGDIEGLKALFVQGLASPLDVCESRGYSILRVCVLLS